MHEKLRPTGEREENEEMQEMQAHASSMLNQKQNSSEQSLPCQRKS